MSAAEQRERSEPNTIERVGVVVHPTRDVQGPVRVLRDWAERRGAEIVQVDVPGQQQEVAERGEISRCDLVAAIGGDGTSLASIRAAAEVEVPVLGVACGSLGILTSVPADEIEGALEAFARGAWRPSPLPCLEIHHEDGSGLVAYNDVAILRAGAGQVRVAASVDGVLYARFAGDGCIVSTPIGSSAYGLAAGGPLLAPGSNAFLLTPLTAHGGHTPPLVMASSSRLRLEPAAGHGGGRLELDGQVLDLAVAPLDVRLQDRGATLVTFPRQEPFLAGLRRRRIIIDSPRILAEDDRRGSREGRAGRAPGDA